MMTEAAEKQLCEEVMAMGHQVGPLFSARKYKESLCALSTLRPSVDRFFDEVMVNVDDAAVRLNRLRLLHELDQLMNKVADISKLAA
jgi:glycyl-tRNA synthetase beta chain